MAAIGNVTLTIGLLFIASLVTASSEIATATATTAAADDDDDHDTELTDEFLVFTDGRAGAVYQMTTNGSTTRIIADAQLNPIAVDYDPINERVYWTNVDAQSISYAALSDMKPTTLVTATETSSLEGIAVDPVARLVFFSDNGKDSIEVISYDGKDQKTIVPIAKHPRSLRLDPIKRKLYWTDWGLGTIERANYDGTGREVVVAVAGEPWLNGITLDLIERRLYWTDAKGNRIESARMDNGNDRKIVVEYPPDSDDKIMTVNGEKGDEAAGGKAARYDPHYFGIAVDETYIYYTDWKNGSVFRMLKDGSEQQAIGWTNHSSLSDIQIFKSARYFKGASSMCSIKNGGCSNLCLPLVNNNYKCACPNNKRLENNNKTCTKALQANGPDLIWLEHDNFFTGFIKGIKGRPASFLRTKEIKTYSIRSPAWHWTAVDMNYAKNKLYLSDKYDRFIVSMSLNGSIDITVIYQGTSPEVNGLAVDWINGNIYWTDSLYNCIMVARDEERTEMVTRIIDTGLDKPHGIAVYPRKGLLFWTDWGQTDRIEQASLAGEDRTVLVKDKLNNPTGLAIDYDMDRLFWSNSDTIESIRLDGTDRVVHSTYYVNHFVDIALYQNYVFATDDSKGGEPQVWFYSRDQPGVQGSRLGLMRHPHGIVMYDHSRQKPAKSPCANHTCDHLCVSTPSSLRRCLCRQGYVLDDDGHSCLETPNPHGPTYVYSMGDRLCSVPVKDSLRSLTDIETFCFFNSTKYEFRAVDYNYYQGDIYFADVKYKVRTIRRSNIYNKDNNSVIVYGVGTVNGLAVDWVASNLYWTDSDLGQIWVSRLDGTYMTPLVSDLYEPHGIAIDMQDRKLYWSEMGDNATHPPLIGVANLDGSSRQQFARAEVESPRGLHVDHHDRRLYWVDSQRGEIHFARLDTSSRSKLNWPESGGKPELYDITTYQDYIVVSEWSSNNKSGLHIFEKETGREASAGLLHVNRHRAYDVLAFDKYNQPLLQGEAISSCVVDNGGCNQLCLHVGTAYRCHCVRGMQLQDDARTCAPVSLHSDKFFLTVDDYTHRIYQFSSHNLSDLSVLQFPPEDRPIAIDYDFTDNRVYWSDFADGVIKRAFMNGSHVQVIKNRVSGSRIDGLAFERHSRLLYYTDTGRHLIGVLSAGGAYHKLLVISEVSSPRAIALDPQKGYMYYATRAAGEGSIERRNMDGTDKHVLFDTNSKVSWPSGIFLNHKAQQLYWVDAHYEKIETSKTDGTGRQILYKADEAADPFGIVVQGDHIFWTDWNLRGLFRVNKNGSDPQVYHSDILSGLNDIKYFDRESLPESTSCSTGNGGCSHMCLPMPGNIPRCACPDDENGPQQTSDGFNCVGVPTCPKYIPNGVLGDSCHARIGVECTFTCNPGFGKSTTARLRCMKGNEWNLDVHALCNDRTCPVLLTPEHSVMDANCPPVASSPVMCHHKCEQGYKRVVGDTVRICLQSRRWSGTQLKCVANSCPPLPVPNHSVVDIHSTCSLHRQPIGTRCLYRCHHGYSIVRGAEHRECTERLEWSGQDVICSFLHEVERTSQVEHNHKQPEPRRESPVKSSPVTPYVVSTFFTLLFMCGILLLLYFIVYKRTGLLSPRQLLRHYRTRHGDVDGDQTPVVAASTPHDKLAAYDARHDSVDLSSSPPASVAFDNPGYAALKDVSSTTIAGKQLTCAHGNPAARNVRTKLDFGGDTSDVKASEEGTADEVDFVNPVYLNLEPGRGGNFRESHI